MIMSDKWITEQCTGSTPLINPFSNVSTSEQFGKPICSRGLSSYGYDLSLGNKFKLLKTRQRATGARYINPNDFDSDLFEDYEVADGGTFVIPPRGFALGVVKEHLIIPNDIMGVCMEKSTTARSAMEVTVTPVEAGWEGFLTLEIVNKSEFDLHLIVGMGITQLMFFKGDQPCSVPYNKRDGKYQNQGAEPIAPRTKKQESQTTSTAEQDAQTVREILSNAIIDKTSIEQDTSVQLYNQDELSKAIDVIKNAVSVDDSYMWAWQCNLAMAFYDSLPKDQSPLLKHTLSNKGAACFMERLFNVDMEKKSLYTELMARIAAETAT